MPELPTPRYVSPAEAARYLGVSRATIYRWEKVQDGPIKKYRFGSRAKIDLHYAIKFIANQPPRNTETH